MQIQKQLTLFQILFAELSATIDTINTAITETKWYSQMYQRTGIWEHLISMLYITVVFFLSTLLIVTNLLSITWYPRVYYLTNQSISAGNVTLKRARRFSQFITVQYYTISLWLKEVKHLCGFDLFSILLLDLIVIPHVLSVIKSFLIL